MRWKQNLFFLSFAQFLSMMGMSFFLPFLPLYLRELGLKSSAEIARWSGLLFSAGFLLLSIAAPIWGMLADRWGRRPMVVRAMGAASVILILSSFVQSPGQLLALRLIHGCFSGFVSAAIALISTEVPEESLGFSLGLFQSALTVGAILGPLSGGILQDHFGTRMTIQIGGFLLLAGTILVFLFVRESHSPVVTEEPPSVWKNMKFMLQHETLFPAARIQFLSNMSIMLVQPIVVLFVAYLATGKEGGLGTLSGLVVSASAISMMIGAPIWGKMADRVGQKRVLTICLFISALTFLPQAAAQSVPGLFIGRLLLGFFAAGIAPSLHALIAQTAPRDRRGGIIGVSFSLTLLGNAFGPLLGGILAASFGLRVPFLTTAVILIVAGIFCRRLPSSRTPPPAAIIAGETEI